MILPATLHKFLVRKITFLVLFGLSSLSKCRLGKVNKVKSQNPTFSLHGVKATDGSLQCIRRRLLAISASKQVEWFYRAVQRATKVTLVSFAVVVRVVTQRFSPTAAKETLRLHRNFAKSHFVVQIYQTDARCGGSRNAIEEMTGEKRCLTFKISYPS